MRCYECGGTYDPKSGDLLWEDSLLGEFIVPGVTWFECNKCHGHMYPLKTARAIDRRRKEIEQERIRGLPLDQFLTAAETAKELGISRQALHKHRRIRRGFIYHTKFGADTFYVRYSIQKFKKEGDGRYPLPKPQEPAVATTDVRPLEFSTCARERDWLQGAVLRPTIPALSRANLDWGRATYAEARAIPPGGYTTSWQK